MIVAIIMFLLEAVLACLMYLIVVTKADRVLLDALLPVFLRWAERHYPPDQEH